MVQLEFAFQTADQTRCGMDAGRKAHKHSLACVQGSAGAAKHIVKAIPWWHMVWVSGTTQDGAIEDKGMEHKGIEHKGIENKADTSMRAPVHHAAVVTMPVPTTVKCAPPTVPSVTPALRAPATLPYTQKPASLVCLQQQQGHKDHLPLPPKHSSCQAHPTITYNCLVPQKRASIQWVVRNSRCRALPSDCWQMHMLLLLLGKRWVGVSCACAHQHPCVPHTYTCDCKDTYTPPTPSPPPHPQTQVSAAEAMEAAVALIGITQAQLHDMTTKYATKLVRGDIVFVLG